jgi:hypothetical protein
MFARNLLIQQVSCRTCCHTAAESEGEWQVVLPDTYRFSRCMASCVAIYLLIHQLYGKPCCHTSADSAGVRQVVLLQAANPAGVRQASLTCRSSSLWQAVLPYSRRLCRVLSRHRFSRCMSSMVAIHLSMLQVYDKHACHFVTPADSAGALKASAGVEGGSRGWQRGHSSFPMPGWGSVHVNNL